MWKLWKNRAPEIWNGLVSEAKPVEHKKAAAQIVQTEEQRVTFIYPGRCTNTQTTTPDFTVGEVAVIKLWELLAVVCYFNGWSCPVFSAGG